MKPETYLALAERLHARARQAQSRGNTHSAADLRLASTLARRYAALLVADEATAEQDATRQHQLTHEAAQTWGDICWLRTACA